MRWKSWILAGVLPCPSVAHADPLGGLALGAGLNVMSSKVQSVVQQAIGGGEILEIQGGGQLSLLISQAQQAYQADSSLTFDRLNGTEKQSISDISSLVDKLLTGSAADIAQISSAALIVANELPLSKTFPQVTSYSPALTMQNAGVVRLTLLGNFSTSPMDSDRPALTINGVLVSASEVLTNSIGFDVPTSALHRSSSSLIENNASVRVPWIEKELYIIPRKRISSFSLPITTLPPNLGNIVINAQISVPTAETKTVTSSVFRQHSDHDDIECGGQHADWALHSVPPDAGYTVIASSVKYNELWHQGAYSLAPCSSATAACFCGHTEHHGMGTSGKVDFTITFDETRPSTMVQNNSQNATLPWSTQKVFNVPATSTWTATLTRFDGSTMQFSGPYSDKFIRVSTLANQITLASAPF